MNSIEYVSHCRAEVRRTFENTRSGKADPTHKHRTEGLLQAARLLGILSPTGISQIMEEEHTSVFGESIAERKERKASLNRLKEESPDSYFDIPAIERRR